MTTNIERMRAAQARKGIRPPPPEPAAPSGTVQAFLGGERSGRAPTKPVRQKNELRYPEGSRITKLWTEKRWEAVLWIGSGPHAGKMFRVFAAGSYPAEFALGQLWLDFLQQHPEAP